MLQLVSGRRAIKEIQASHVILQVTGDQFILNFDPCPGGYELGMNSNMIMECQCLDKVKENVVNCEQDQDSVIIQASHRIYKF